MIIHNLIQGSEEWIKIRLGKLTGSDFHILMGDSQTKETLLYKKAAERLTKTQSDGDRFSNIHTERGKQLEDEARSAYELETGLTIEQVGFIENDEFAGCSPDGLLINGGVEIKCPDNHGFLKAVVKEWIAPEHRTQVQFNMCMSEKAWWDYVLYNPNFHNSLKIMRVIRDEAYIVDIRKCISKCNETIKQIMNKF